MRQAGVISWKHGQNERLHKRAEKVAENEEDRICGSGRRKLEGNGQQPREMKEKNHIMYHRHYPPDGSSSKNSRHRWLCNEVINTDQSRHVCNVFPVCF